MPTIQWGPDSGLSATASVTGCQKQGDFSENLAPLLAASFSFHILFQRRHDRRPIVAMAGNGVPHPTVKQRDENRRCHKPIFKIEELLNISTPSWTCGVNA